MHKPESVQEDKTDKILCDFEIQADHLIAVRKPDLVLNNKKKEFVIYCILPFLLIIKESEKIDKYLDLPKNCKTLEYNGDTDTNCSWCA